MKNERRKTNLPREGEEGRVEGKDGIRDELEVGGGDDHTAFVEETSKECDGVFHTEERKQLREVSPSATKQAQQGRVRNKKEQSRQNKENKRKG